MPLTNLASSCVVVRQGGPDDRDASQGSLEPCAQITGGHGSDHCCRREHMCDLPLLLQLFHYISFKKKLCQLDYLTKG